jgi:predicted outer membrane protein
MGMDVSSMDCPTIMDHMHTMMMGGGDHMGAMSTDSTASAGMDKTFLMLADEMMHHAQMAAKMELKCGKDPKTMAFAKKMLDDQDYNDAQVKALMTGFP